MRSARRLGLLDRELGVAEQFLRVLAGLHHRQPDRAFDLDLEVGQLERRGHHLLDPVGRLHRIVHAPAERNDDPEFIAAGARQPVAGAQCRDQPPGERDQQFVADQSPHAFVDAAEAQHVDDQHGMPHRPHQPVGADHVAGTAFGIFDHFAEREPIWQAGQAVAKHFGAQRAFRLDLDGPVDQRQQAPRLGAIEPCQRRQPNPEIARRHPVAIAKLDLVAVLRAVEELLDQGADRTVLEAFGAVPVGCRAGRIFDGIGEAFVMRQYVQFGVGLAGDDGRGDRKRVEQVAIGIDQPVLRRHNCDTRGIAPRCGFFRSLHAAALTGRG